MLIDHVGVDVTDFDASKIFYDAALGPLQVAVLFQVPIEHTAGARVMGYGKTADSGHIQAGKPSFWIAEGTRRAQGLHVAFVAETRDQVDAFHAGAMAAGGRDNGGPGVRPHYHPNYYGAFVLDPDGYNVEAVCHGPPGVTGSPIHG